ncbi:hypothetical protein [Nocardia sp. NPDC050710]|uniref:hypothetical protein n=1 Tax=Nocardia sp. NPDC050710 TaxID=3157220 RepID=UPI0033CA8A24
MSIYLPAPRPNPRGPDGRGWNRISLGAHYGAPASQCALRPHTYPALVDIRRGSRFSAWGPYDPCPRAPYSEGERPDCLNCPVLTEKVSMLDIDADRVLVRLECRTVGTGFATEARLTPWIVTDVAAGWDSPHQHWPWHRLARLEGWNVGRAHHDDCSEGFWLIRNHPADRSAPPKTD